MKILKQIIRDILDKLPIVTKRKQALANLAKESEIYSARNNPPYPSSMEVDSVCESLNTLSGIHERNQ